MGIAYLALDLKMVEAITGMVSKHLGRPSGEIVLEHAIKIAPDPLVPLDDRNLAYI